MKKISFQRRQKGRIGGFCPKSHLQAFTHCGIQALECGFLTKAQVEAIKLAIKRIYVRHNRPTIFVRPTSFYPIMKKPQETRMGKGKGTKIRDNVVKIKKGQFILELKLAKKPGNYIKALRQAQHRLPIQTKLIRRKPTI